MLRTFLAFGRTDASSIRRDSTLVSIIITPWLLVLLLRLGVPSLHSWLESQHGINLEQYYSLIVSIFVFLNIPLLFGVMSGFLLLDERDDDTLSVIRITPASVNGLLIYRMVTGFLLSTLYIFLCAPLTGLVPLDGILRAFPSVFLASMFTPVVMLALVAFARNKLEGFAVLKGVGIVVVGSVAAYFVENTWQILFGLIPTYWAVSGFWLALDDESIGWRTLIGVLYNLLLIVLLYRRFQTRLDQK